MKSLARLTDLKMTNKDEYYMSLAIKEAKKASLKDEVPIGAVLVYEDKVYAKAHNLRVKTNKTASHAEMLVIEKANKKFGSWRLEDMTLYVTLEPCPMCAGTILQSRLKRVVYGANDPKAGALGSVFNLFEHKFNHTVEVTCGILEEECSELIKSFFKELRQKN